MKENLVFIEKLLGVISSTVEEIISEVDNFCGFEGDENYLRIRADGAFMALTHITQKISAEYASSAEKEVAQRILSRMKDWAKEN